MPLSRLARPLAYATVVLGFACALRAANAEVKIEVRGSQIAGPAQEDRGEEAWRAALDNWKRDYAGSRAAWLVALRAWRAEQLQRLRYDDAQYRRPELAWTQRNFVQPQAMVEDRYFYDPLSGRYTVDRYLDDLVLRYGGIDSVLLWPVYPNIGIDNRNQWDLLRDLPGGIEGVRAMIADFHRRGVKVLFPTMPWDIGSRAEGADDATATARLLAEIGADGINGDTCPGLTEAFRIAADAAGRPLALEPELSMGEDAMLQWNHQSWAYWEYPFVPRVSKWKWLEPRHLIHVCDRWATDRTEVLHSAFFNGVGVESWENVWGWWNGFTPRDAEALRRISAIYRAVPELLVSAEWEPHVPTRHYGVYASAFPSARRTLWTVVNRNSFALHEAIIALPHRAGRSYYDLWNGVPLQPRIVDGQAVCDVPLEPRGFGAILAVDAAGAHDDAELAMLLAAQRERAERPLASYSAEWKFLPQQLVEIASTAPVAQAPAGMVRVPAGEFDFQVRGVEIEGENRPGLDVQYPWESSPRREHLHRMKIPTFFMDRHPVTNAEFKRFLDVSGYRPADTHNFLRHWRDGAPSPGDEQRPVVWVSLEDARAYASWAGKRLPHEWEWQYAAQGVDGRTYPWGNEWDDSAVPAPHRGRDLPPAPAVGQHPRGASPFGIEDLVGTVWQWTDEFVDEHTRAAVLRGGSYYQPQGSSWYFPANTKLSEHGKYLLMAPAKDRAGTLGFRCVKDSL